MSAITSRDESRFVGHEPCPKCGSQNNLARYSDGHGFCFTYGCEYYEAGEGQTKQRSGGHRVADVNLLTGEIKALSKRGISEETCAKFGYMVGVGHNGVVCQIAPYHDADGKIVAQHLRYPNKDFAWLGNAKAVQLWGQHLWRDSGKRVIITEGEIDCMSISQLQSNKWPVVSIPSGVGRAKKDISGALEWLERFEEVVFAFDMDEPGQKAAKECALLLSPGKAKLWSIPLKDANEMLVAWRADELINALWGAKEYRPDGIVSATETWELLVKEDENSNILYPWSGLNAKTCGLRRGELVTFTAGTGVGKSTLCREIAHHLITRGEKVGYMALEENVQRSIRGLVALELNKPIHLPEVRKQVPEADLRAAFERIKHGAFFYDHWGSTDSDSLLSKIRFMARGCGCGWVVLDHLSIVVSGDGEGEERRKIDNLMTALRKLVEEVQIGLLLVSHLKRPEGKAHEEGGQTSLSQLRGSAAIGQLSDIVIGSERNQQDEEKATITTVRVLKNRFSGETGVATFLNYNKETGRMSEVSDNPFKEEEGNTSGGGKPDF